MGSDLKINKKIQKYIYDKGLKLHPIQQEIINYNKSLGKLKKMQISISQSQFLYLIVKISNIKNILEIGTFTGLSTLSMALALPKNGKIIALDRNEETNIVATNFFKKANLENKIKTIINPALETLGQIKDQKFDLIFIDADKLNYKNYYEHSISLINTNGLIIIDNVLWHGEVVNENTNDKLTLNIQKFNNYVTNDKRVEKVIIPLGDGMTVCRKL
ncbi:MAG: methyltransferase domain-containing protein [Alphaproteobacteria bacterium]|nr:methyltransferase domain-containing protein [Alphaproteobacteria bacterium]